MHTLQPNPNTGHAAAPCTLDRPEVTLPLMIKATLGVREGWILALGLGGANPIRVAVGMGPIPMRVAVGMGPIPGTVAVGMGHMPSRVAVGMGPIPRRGTLGWAILYSYPFS